MVRGSQNTGDWITNLQLRLARVKLKYKQVKHEVGIHSGFWKRLMEVQPEKNGLFSFKSYEEQPDESLLQHIKSELLDIPKNFLKNGKTYSLFVTGHSLGGAQATLAGLGLAIDDDIRRAFTGGTGEGPVTVVSFASPRVGNHQFRRLHQTLEDNDHLRHLRIMNNDDIVPYVPWFSLRTRIPGLYTHVGLRWIVDKDVDEGILSDVSYPDIENDGSVSFAKHTTRGCTCSASKSFWIPSTFFSVASKSTPSNTSSPSTAPEPSRNSSASSFRRASSQPEPPPLRIPSNTSSPSTAPPRTFRASRVTLRASPLSLHLVMH